MNSKLKDDIHLNIGETDCQVAMVFSCPGLKEKEKGKPVAGQTGVHLNELLKILNEKNTTIFPKTDRYWYRITNSSSQVRPNNTCARTEPTIKEIEDKKNIDRIRNEISDMTYIICFGRKAEIALREMRSKVHDDVVLNVAYVKHLGLQSLNRWKTKEKTDLKGKLNIIAGEILDKLKL